MNRQDHLYIYHQHQQLIYDTSYCKLARHLTMVCLGTATGQTYTLSLREMEDGTKAAANH